jgi:putative ABC transport system substrate-binding protein
VEGETIVIEYRSSDGQPERFPALAAELAELPVDAIVVGDFRALADALKATTTIPVVTPIGDASGTGLEPSLPTPSGNLTGVTNLATGLSGKRLQLLHAVAPAASRVAVLRNAALPNSGPLMAESQAAAQTLGIELLELEIQSADDIEGAFGRATAEGADGLVVLPDPLANTNAREIVRRANQAGLPTMYGVRLFVDAGGLMAHGPNREQMYRRAAYYVNRILRGARPSDLPIEQPTAFDLVINLKTARELGVSLPPSVLIEATDLIE